MNKYIKVWQNYGENPCEGLEELGYYSDFLRKLSECQYDINSNEESNCLYRGLSSFDYTENQIINLTKPTSWSESKSVANKFAGKALLILRLFKETCGYRIPPNEYKEKEVILAPLKLRIIRICGNHVYVYVE